jgi:cytidyltransferase-like protein
MLAVAAYQRAAKIVGNDDVVGVGATSKLATANEREDRKHAVHVTIHGRNRTRTTTVPLGSHARSREAEEQVAADIIVKEYCTFLEVPCSPPNLYNCEKVATADITSPWSLDSSATVQVVPFHCCDASPLKDEKPIIFSGSFNPVHEGHIKVAEHAHRLTGKAVWFEISLTNCEKPAVDWVSLQERVASFDAYRDNMSIAGLVFTNAPMFVDKAKWFHKPTFIVGRDTASRIDNPRLYDSADDYVDSINELLRRQVEFLVFDRKGSLKHPFKSVTLEKICTPVDDYEDAGENSTDIRRHENG